MPRARLCIGRLFAPMHSGAGEVCVGANSLPTHTFPGGADPSWARVRRTHAYGPAPTGYWLADVGIGVDPTWSRLTLFFRHRSLLLRIMSWLSRTM